MRAPLRQDYFAAFPAFPPEVVAVLRKSTHYPWGLLANLDSLDSLDIGFRSAGEAGPATAGRAGYRMNNA